MVGIWWWLWIFFIFIFFVTPVGYGWGYRGWGPPYPRYIQRRRGLRAASMTDSMSVNHLAWGIVGDLVWMVLIISFVWAAVALWWR